MGTRGFPLALSLAIVKGLNNCAANLSSGVFEMCDEKGCRCTCGTMKRKAKKPAGKKAAKKSKRRK